MKIYGITIYNIASNYLKNGRACAFHFEAYIVSFKNKTSLPVGTKFNDR